MDVLLIICAHVLKTMKAVLSFMKVVIAMMSSKKEYLTRKAIQISSTVLFLCMGKIATIIGIESVIYSVTVVLRHTRM